MSNRWTKEKVTEEASYYNSIIKFKKESPKAYNVAYNYGWIDDVCEHMPDKRKPSGYWNYDMCKREALKYDSKVDFNNNNGAAYNSALKNKWLNGICFHMSRPKNQNFKWTYEKCKEEALKYQTRIEFQKKSSGAYGAAFNNRWVDSICTHMSNGNIKWTKIQCHIVALKYKSRNEFKNSDENCYAAARRNNWLDEICSHMDTKKTHPKNYWTKERCHEVALKCKSRNNFRKIYGGAYSKACVNGWLDEICSHMDTKKTHPKNYWTKERCHEVALKCKSRAELQQKYKSVIHSAQRNGWLDEICSHMTPLGNKIKRLIYVFEFNDNHAYIGLTYNSSIRKNSHLTIDNSAVKKHIDRNPLVKYTYKELTEYIGVEEAVKMEEYYVNFYKENGWDILNRVKTGALGGNIIKWTKEKCHDEALKYDNKTDFQNNSSGAYGAAKRNDWFNDVCSHMIPKYKPIGYWDDYNNCKEEALKYKNKTQFIVNSGGAYKSALINGWLDDICKHMYVNKLPDDYWENKELCHNEALKYNNRSDFKKLSSVAYETSRRNGWLDDICSHINNTPYNKKWTYDTCKEEALKYKSRKEFGVNSKAYDVARKNGWLDKFCTHMERPKNHNYKWTKEKVKEEAEKYKLRSHFKKGSGGAFNVAKKNGWLDEFFPKK